MLTLLPKPPAPKPAPVRKCPRCKKPYELMQNVFICGDFEGAGPADRMAPTCTCGSLFVIHAAMRLDDWCGCDKPSNYVHWRFERRKVLRIRERKTRLMMLTKKGL